MYMYNVQSVFQIMVRSEACPLTTIGKRFAIGSGPRLAEMDRADISR